MHDRIHINLSEAQDTMKETHSKINKNKTMKFNPGERVLLSTKIQRPNRPDKLQACYTGLHLVKKKCSNISYQLNIPTNKIK
jgi:hypothetical protein